MRHQLLTGVAIAALSLSIASAVAQDRNSGAAAGGAAPGASSAPSTSSSGERGGAAAGRGDDRSAPQGQRASEGAGRDGATRNASERGQERSAQGRDNNDQKSGPASAQSGASSGDRDQRGGAASSSSSSAQRGSADQNTDANKSGADRSTNSSASGANERNSQPSSSAAGSNDRDNDRNRSQSTSTQNAPSQSNPREGAVQNNNQNPSASSSSSSVNTNTSSSSSTRTGSDQNRAASSGGQSSTNVQVRGELNVDQQSATRVHDRLIRDSGARETDINIKIDLGGRVPDRVRLRPVPAEIVEISPRYRNYEYTIVRDEIVIVEPKTKKVVQVISGGSNGARKSSHVVRLDTKQRDLVKRDVLKTRTGSVNRQDFSVELRQGVEVPDRVTLQAFPEDVWRDAPELREVRYFIIQDEVVLVDPDTREVIEILR